MDWIKNLFIRNQEYRELEVEEGESMPLLNEEFVDISKTNETICLSLDTPRSSPILYTKPIESHNSSTTNDTYEKLKHEAENIKKCGVVADFYKNIGIFLSNDETMVFLDDFHVDSRPQTTHYSKSNNTLQYCEYGSAYP